MEQNSKNNSSSQESARFSPKTDRKFFTKLHDAIPLPDLIESQKESYDWFLKEGLRELFDEVSPIKDFIGRDLELYLEDYYLDEPKFDELTARSKNVTYEAAIRVKARLVNKRSGEIKEQEIYLGDFPMMTPRGTFIINGIERVIVSQLIRSAGVFFTSDIVRGKIHYGAKVIPNRGAWLELETDANGAIWVKIDRKRKVAITSLLRAFGYGTDSEIKEVLGKLEEKDSEMLEETLKRDSASNEDEGLKEVYKRIRPGDLATASNAKQLIHAMFFNFDRYDFSKVGRYKINERFAIDVPNDKEHRILRREDLILVIHEIMRLTRTQEVADDIDHLSNRRVRTVGELVQNKLRVGLARMERIIKDRMSTLDINTITPNQLINARPVIGSIKEFFMSSQLSQFMDQTNPLAELEHKRRLSAMGPGGLSRERAGFDVRDVHKTHYGRICPIATPEGPNIGLVGHLASYARINQFGFLETPYSKVVAEDSGKVKVTREVVFMSALEESQSVTTAATAEIDENGYFISDKVEARVKGEPMFVDTHEVKYMDISAKQIVSIATSLIPFLEHDDAVRALMGTNMQRQAIAVVRPESPVVGTGVEYRAAMDSGQVILSEDNGEVVGVQSDKITIKHKKETKEYNLGKFVRSNASTSMNQKPIVNKGDKVNLGEVIADGAATDGGELALGQNVLVAFLSWEGGNYEDAILISERLVQDDRYTSIHIDDYTIDIRDTKLGPEVITRDIPNVGEDKLADLDAEGIVRIGAEVSSGDILVGKITPKGEAELSAEEKLLRAIFGEKAKDVRDSSLYLEHGEHGKVVQVKIFSRENGDKLPSGVIKSIQVSVASLRKVQVGDKMAGRHGNKGVISKIVPAEDMPFDKDGRQIDIILNPLGVASRMNLGQILETHLGLAAHKLGYKVASPVLDGVPDEVIRQELKKAGYPEDGKIELYDGKTGKKFDQKVTVGYIYMLKLNHLVEDKIHQRSIGPYSLVTQQPLGGKAQFGGQRFGEMEVWALEAYGAAHTLQEILTIKSDDVPGRSKAYEAIIKGDSIEKRNVPESFNVLVRELKGLGLDVELLRGGKVVAEHEENSDQ
ncbi:DNA-directed RNA polymerase subunit beta [bacterium]|jgi:DNA-directed RNA polymerase subunit beta|nr:DNA-directed RNA polymerase subunit beta [bacterium]MDP6571665.1 DNA-directed RNA polymerase subunit beta [Patescibacteria group bacterium]MDP6756241.1 DNA-directed RNA polymerase subunit beta [Patescibacteria group bacterium]|tara:strand:- start:9052 stop:12306 length:3255 start_codon:yes stop_codon:yes gene_type:complete